MVKRFSTGIFLAIALAAGLAQASPARKAPTPTTPQKPAPAPSPVIANEWLEIIYARTKLGPRVCPLGIEIDSLSSRPCGEKADLISVDQYLESFRATCPGGTMVSAQPLGRRYKALVIGYRAPATGPCPTPIGAERIL